MVSVPCVAGRGAVAYTTQLDREASMKGSAVDATSRQSHYADTGLTDSIEASGVVQCEAGGRIT